MNRRMTKASIERIVKEREEKWRKKTLERRKSKMPIV